MAAQGQAQAKLAKRMERELEWVRSSPKARQAKSKARLANYDAMVAEEMCIRDSFGTDPVMRQIGSTIDWNMPSIPRISVG